MEPVNDGHVKQKGLNQSQNEEKIILQEASQGKHGFDNNLEVKNILLDFDNLDFSDGPFDHHFYDVNYNEGKEADPFDKIAKYYGRNKNSFLFISMLRDTKQLEKIINLISKKCDVQAKEKFIKRMNIYLDRISKGEYDAKEFLDNSDHLDAFFNGYHIPCPGHNRNIHENLNINVTKPQQTLETSSYFSRTTKRIEEEKSEIKRVKIYNNGKRIITIEKNERQQRNYFFTKLATFNLEISWSAKDESGKDINCKVVLNINSGQVNIGKTTTDDKDVEPKDILELAMQNEVVLIKNTALPEVLAENLNKQTPYAESKSIQSHENVVIPGPGVPSSAVIEGTNEKEGISYPQ